MKMGGFCVFGIVLGSDNPEELLLELTEKINRDQSELSCCLYGDGVIVGKHPTLMQYDETREHFEHRIIAGVSMLHGLWSFSRDDIEFVIC